MRRKRQKREDKVMHLLKKLYCRTFQLGMRTVLPILPYREPKPLKSIQGIIPILKRRRIKRVLLVTDHGVRKAGITKPLERLLIEENIQCFIYDKTVANPTVANVEEAVKLYRRGKCRALIAVGGGSAMDCAKAVGARVVRPHTPLQRMEGILKVIKKLPLLIAVPTTAGTGSETTLAAVITDGKTHRKYPINDFVLIPRYAILDPQMTISLPPHLTATTGMDALTHAVEAYIGRSTTKHTRTMAVDAIRLIFENLEIAYEDGNNYEARQNMLRAAYLAGASFTQSYVGYVHAIAHSLGGKYGMAHGMTNAVLLPIVLEEYGKTAYERLADLARRTGISYDINDEVAAKKFIAKIREMNKRMGIPSALSGILEEDIEALAKHADHEANPLYPVPVLWDEKQLKKIYYLVGEDIEDDRVANQKNTKHTA